MQKVVVGGTWHLGDSRQVHTHGVQCRYFTEDNNLEELGVDRMIMLNVKEIGWESVHRVNLIIVVDSDTWRRQ
jgi:hypothetical protein